MTVPSSGFCIHVQRLREEKRASKSFSRTIGEYQCYWNGTAIQGLSGQLAERGGPGDNTTAIGNAKDLRIKAGIYLLAVHRGSRYRTSGYTTNLSTTATPRPGILLKKTEERTAILIHPGGDYVWSVGCLNPTSSLVDSKSPIDFVDSRTRVIAIIDAMKELLQGSFPTAAGATIPSAVVLIDGEPQL